MTIHCGDRVSVLIGSVVEPGSVGGQRRLQPSEVHRESSRTSTLCIVDGGESSRLRSAATFTQLWGYVCTGRSEHNFAFFNFHKEEAPRLFIITNTATAIGSVGAVACPPPLARRSYVGIHRATVQAPDFSSVKAGKLREEPQAAVGAGETEDMRGCEKRCL